MIGTRLDDMAGTIGGVLVDAAVRGAACAVLAGLLLAIVRVRSAASKLAAWTAVLAVSSALPIAGGLPGWRLAVPAAIVRRVAPIAPAGDGIRIVQSPWRRSAATSAAFVGIASPVPDQRNSLPAQVANQPRWRPKPLTIGCIVYLVLALTCVTRTIVGWRLTRRIVRSASPVPDAVARAALARVTPAGHRRCPDVLESDRVFVPMTAGIVRAVLVLPADWLTWPDRRLDAVLAHELAHVVRRDVLRLALARFYRDVFWFTPVSWWLDRRIGALVEEASDDGVLRAGAEPATYAETLLAFASRAQAAGGRAAWRLGVVRSVAATERRVDRILAWRTSHTSMPRARVVAAATLALVPAMLVASARPVTRRDADAADIVLPSAATSATPTLETPVVTITSGRVLPPGTSGATERSIASNASIVSTARTPEPAAASPASDDVQSASSTASTQTAAGPSSAGRSFGPAALAGKRVWILLFDLAGASDDEWQRATAAAARWAAERMTPTDVVAVATVGSTLQVIQDFTSDPDRVRASLEALGGAAHSGRPTAPPSGAPGLEVEAFTNDVRLRAMKTICDDLSGIGERKALMYFGVGMTRNGSDTQTELRAMEQSCTRANVQIDTVDSRGLEAAADRIAGAFPTAVASPPTVATSLIPDAPLTVIGISLIAPGTSIAGGVLEPDTTEVTLRNDSAKTVRAVQLGTLSTVHGAPSLPFVRGPEITVEIPPGASRTVECRLLDSTASGRLADLVGILHVDFTDGWSWDYQPKTGGGLSR